LILLLGLVFTAALVHASDDDEASGGASGGESGGAAKPAAKPKAQPKAQPKAKAKPAKAKAAKVHRAPKRASAPAPRRSAPSPSRHASAPRRSGIPLQALSALPVEPLAMDAAALRDDDTQFDQLPKQLSGKENVHALTHSLKKAALLLNKMKRDVEGEKVWTKNVYDIIQNYQYKYLKTVEDVKMRQKKVKKMEHLVSLLKRSTLHSAVEKELTKASKVLRELVTRSGGNGAVYSKVSARMAKLKNALATMPRPQELYSETTNKMQRILKSKLPPQTSDALKNLANGVTGDDAANAAKAAAKKAAKAAAAAAAAKAAKTKKNNNPKKASAKKAPKSKKSKAGKAAKKAAKAGKKKAK